MQKPVKILVVDDSRTSRMMLVGLLSQAAGLQVIAQAENGTQAVEMAKKHRPDVIVMDIVMPDMDGLEATREIMAICPTPIVLVTASLESHETDVAFRAIKQGALTVMQKPASISNQAEVQFLVSTVRAMSEVKVIHHHNARPKIDTGDLPGAIPTETKRSGKVELIGIVASTGGPGALSDIIRGLPTDFTVPIVIVQHIAADFVASLVKWFSSITSLKVEIAEAGAAPQPGVIYVAPGDTHLRLNAQRYFERDRRQGLSPHVPSGDVLLESLASSYGPEAIGVLLTGMGADGARGLRAMFDAGAHTIAQDQSTSVVFGMPAEAIRLHAARQVLPIQDIARNLVLLARKEVKYGK